jgi:hypothetical protein
MEASMILDDQKVGAIEAGPINEHWLSGGGELGELIRSFDWAKTPLGQFSRWPQSLKTVVKIMLDSRYAMWLGWGPDFIFLYNDAYAKMPNRIVGRTIIDIGNDKTMTVKTAPPLDAGQDYGSVATEVLKGFGLPVSIHINRHAQTSQPAA